MKKLISLLFVLSFLISCESSNTNLDDNIDYRTNKQEEFTKNLKKELENVGSEIKKMGDEIKKGINKEVVSFPEGAPIKYTISHYIDTNTFPNKYTTMKEPRLHQNGWISFWHEGNKVYLHGVITVIESPLKIK